MDAELLGRVFGRDQRWQGPCTIIMNAEAAVHAFGMDSILGGGAKQFAPRAVSGRINADAVCLAQSGKVLVILQHQKVRQQTGEDALKQTLTLADTTHVVAVEFPDTAPLATLGLAVPAVKNTGSHPGTQMRPA